MISGAIMELAQKPFIDGTAELAPVVSLSNSQKAAVIVRLLVSEGAMPRLSGLNLRQQEKLVRQMAELSIIDRKTLASVAREFAHSLDNLGLTFPGSMQSALDMIGDHLTDDARAHIADAAEAEGPPDPWRRISGFEIDRLKPLLEGESAEICAILLSKLPVAKAAILLAELPPDRAHIVAHAVSLTSAVDPETLIRVGTSLAGQLEDQTEPVFSGNPAERVGAILNAATAATRDAVLEGLSNRDADFAGIVRKSIFTFEHIPKRIEPKDVPRIMRGVDGNDTIVALAAGMVTAPVAVEFLLENMSKRMAEQLREDAESRGKVKTDEGEAAMGAIVASIRDLADSSEIRLIEEEE